MSRAKNFLEESNLSFKSEAVLLDDLAVLSPMGLKYARDIVRWRISDRARFLHEGAKTEDEQREWMRDRPDSEKNFMILCGCGQVVGMVSLVGIDTVAGLAEPARFFIQQEFSAYGFAVVAMYQLYELAFRTLSLNRLLGRIALENKKMLRWHQHFGAIVTGQSESKEKIRGAGRTLVNIELTSSRYRSFTAPKMSLFVEQLRSLKLPDRCLCTGTLASSSSVAF